MASRCGSPQGATGRRGVSDPTQLAKCEPDVIRLLEQRDNDRWYVLDRETQDPTLALAVMLMREWPIGEA